MSDQGERFSRRHCLQRRQEFRAVFARGRRIHARGFNLVICDNDLGYPRLGLAVGRKVGNAVVRNRVKRRLREIFRRNREALPGSADLVVIAHPGAAKLDFEQLRRNMLGACARYVASATKGS